MKTLAKFTYGFFSGILLTLSICVLALAKLSVDAQGGWMIVLFFSILNIIIAFVSFITKEW